MTKVEWSTIDEGLKLEGEPLLSGERLELKTKKGRLLPVEWYADPRGRRAVFVQLACADDKAFKTLVQLPNTALVRRKK
jgi:hypothetical protein